MRGVILAAVFAAVVLGNGSSSHGQDDPPKKAEPKYLPVKELDKRAKAALEVVRKREEGYVDKGIELFGEVMVKADPASPAAQRIAGQAGYFQQRLFVIKENAAFKEYDLFGGDDRLKELEKVREDRKLWGRLQGVHNDDVLTLSKAWDMVQREWALADLKKK